MKQNSQTRAWGDDPEEFPETLFDYMRQKKWERSVYLDDLKRVHTAKFGVQRNQRLSRSETIKAEVQRQKKVSERARTVGPLVYRNRQGRITKTDTPGVRLTEKLVQPVTRMKYVFDFLLPFPFYSFDRKAFSLPSSISFQQVLFLYLLSEACSSFSSPATKRILGLVYHLE